MARITVAIPTHDMKGKEAFLKRSLDVLKRQTYRNFDVVITDDSKDEKLKKVCVGWPFKITYIHNPERLGMAGNSNWAIRNATGELIKILYLDDFLYGDDALYQIHLNFPHEAQWLATGCTHAFNGDDFSNPRYPSWNDKIYNGNNTIGSPSVVTLRNDQPLLFDENLTWLLDCDLYMRYYEQRGAPVLLGSIGVVIQIGDHQVTSLLADEVKTKEYNYLLNKYE